MIRSDSEQVEQVQGENMVDDILGTNDGHIQVSGLDDVANGSDHMIVADDYHGLV